MYEDIDIVVTQVDDVMVLAHPNGCIEVVACELEDFGSCATYELNYYLLGGDVTHNACEFGCAGDETS